MASAASAATVEVAKGAVAVEAVGWGGAGDIGGCDGSCSGEGGE